jgi:tetratricopeptide (TPR) repeat protein
MVTTQLVFSIAFALCADDAWGKNGLVSPAARAADASVAVQSIAASNLVNQALRCEERNDVEGRRTKLLAALESDPDYAPAHWQLGQVRFAEQWMTPELIASRIRQQRDTAAYEEERRRTPDTLDGHLNLAQWCRARQKPDEERAHLLVAARLDPNDPRLRRLLGLRRHKGRWMTDRDSTDAAAQKLQMTRVYQATKKNLLALGQELGSADIRRCERTEDQILALRDPRTIPAIEDVLGTANERSATLAVRVLSTMPEREATQALARQGLWSQWESVRHRAVEELRSREATTFVPDLVELLTPCDWSPEQWVRMPDGTIANVRVAQNLGATDILVTRYALPSAAYSIMDGQAARVASQGRAGRITAVANFRVQRAADVLGSFAGVDLGTDQPAWRKWWSEYNYSYEQPNYYPTWKPSHYLFADAPAVAMSYSCFVAGTPVWTRRGPVPIDHVQLGDLVLSMHPETGELAYRAVVGRTIRPATQLKNIEIDGTTIVATLGHPFWVAGKGWVRAKDLRSKDPIRLCGSTALLDSIGEGQKDTAYNLEVAEFNTYFVGTNKILVHDNNPINHAFRTVPGLVASDE